MKIKNRQKHWIFIGLFWCVLGLAIWAQMLKEYAVLTAIYQTVLTLFCCIVTAHYLSDVLLPRALHKNDMKTFLLQGLFYIILLSTFLGLISTVATQFFLENRLHTDGAELSILHLFWERFYSSIPSAVLINGTACGIRFYQEHSAIEKNHALLQKDHLEAQIKILQDQINPHLMFNILNHIHILMQSNVELASVLLVRFSDILRYQLYECNREFVFLGREIKYLKDLIAIEQIRWGDELEVETPWSIDNGTLQIVPLLLVPLIENAFKHVSRLPNKKGFVYLHCHVENKQLTLHIRNSHTERYKAFTNSQGLGLENVKKRLEIQYPEQHLLKIEKTDKEFLIQLTLDLKTNLHPAKNTIKAN